MNSIVLKCSGVVCLSVIFICLASARAHAQAPATQTAPASGGQAAQLMTCTSQIGERMQCTTDTSSGVALVRSSGAAPCLFGDTWGFDATSIWVADGCSGLFLLGGVAQVPTQVTQVKQNAPSYVPNAGFLLVDGETLLAPVVLLEAGCKPVRAVCVDRGDRLAEGATAQRRTAAA